MRKPKSTSAPSLTTLQPNAAGADISAREIYGLGEPLLRKALSGLKSYTVGLLETKMRNFAPSSLETLWGSNSGGLHSKHLIDGLFKH